MRSFAASAARGRVPSAAAVHTAAGMRGGAGQKWSEHGCLGSTQTGDGPSHELLMHRGRATVGGARGCGSQPYPTIRYPMRAVISGVVVPLPRIEYRYGVFGSSPISVKDVSVTVAIGMPERSTS